jgi:hypothetical protein
MKEEAQHFPRNYLTEDGQLLGAAGTYYVMSELSARGFHASCTFGNAPHVDILVSSADGACSVAVQVKSTSYAKRWRGKRAGPKKLAELQWYLGRKAAKANLKGLFIIFVDFDKFGVPPETECYVVPSAFIFNVCKSWVDEVSMVRLHISPGELEPYRGAWHLIGEALKASLATALPPGVVVAKSIAKAAARS